MQMVFLPEYQPAQPVETKPTPDSIPYALDDQAVLDRVVHQAKDLDVRVAGRHGGYIEYHRQGHGMQSLVIEKKYVNFSDDGVHFYRGEETAQLAPASNSVYTANVKLTGPKSGQMNLKITFGPLHDKSPARLIFDRDESGVPQSYGYSQYADKKLELSN